MPEPGGFRGSGSSAPSMHVVPQLPAGALHPSRGALFTVQLFTSLFLSGKTQSAGNHTDKPLSEHQPGRAWGEQDRTPAS